MNEWVVVTALATLLGIFVTVGKPLIDLNKTITTLNLNVEHMNQRLDKQENELKLQETKAHESHEKLWQKNTEQDKQLIDHESRIKTLETKNET